MLAYANYWRVVISAILQNYFSHVTTTCILRHHLFLDILEPSINSNVYLQINPVGLQESFQQDIYNFTQQDKYFNDNQVFYNDLIKKFIAAILNANCEGFVAFQEDIPLFAYTFRKASLYSIWRSIYNRFLFVHVKANDTEEYFQDVFFKIQNYFSHVTTTCILRHQLFLDILEPSINSNVYLQINPVGLQESFQQDIYNFTQQDKYFNDNQVFYNDLIKKFIAAILNANCEGFVAFQEDIPLFAYTFRKASLYSIWRSIYNRFLFVYVKANDTEEYFQDVFFKNQANILVIEADYFNASTFSIKTNKFVGPLDEHPEQLVYLTTYNAMENSFTPEVDLFLPDKLKDLQGRELIVAALNYRPFVALEYDHLPLYPDRAEDNPTHLVHVDGVETRITHTFCELYNCSIQFDTTEKEEWGTSYYNYTGYGLIGMIMEGKVDMATGAMFAWNTDYMAVDVTNFIGRSGVTCLVPAPSRIVSWDLPVRPFRTTLWLIILLVIVMEAVCLLLFRYFEKFVENTLDSHAWYTSAAFGFISSSKLFIGQGTDYLTNGYTLRVMLFACYMHDIIVTSVYGGGLSAILTLPIMEEAADSVARLYSHDLIWVATTLEWIESLKDDDDPLYVHLSNRFRAFKLEEIREMAKTENMAFAMERLAYNHFGNLEFLTPESVRRLKLMVDDIYYGHTVAMVARCWALLPKYNDLILNWRSSGFDKLWEWKITAEYLNVNEQNQVAASRYYNFEDEGPVTLGMDNFGGIMLIWLVGIAISVIAFGVEILVDKVKQRKLIDTEKEQQ